MTDVLPHRIEGPESPVPVVLLHGFGGERQVWTALQVALAHRRRTIAFDLPGHGAALDWPEVGHAGISARHVIASLDRMGIGAFHLVGHSMGGATAAIMGLKLLGTGRIASFTLLCPGAFGAEIDAEGLRAYATATTEAALDPAVRRMYAPGFRLPRQLIPAMLARRADPRVTETLGRIVESILDGPTQKRLEVERLVEHGVPLKLIWGREDRTIPPSQVSGLPGLFGVHLFDGVGHMPHVEIPREVARLVAEATR